MSNENPLEVQLVMDVKSCRKCQWFWGGVPPYGNFPVFDWNEDYPAAVLNQKQTTAQVTEPLLMGKSCGTGQVEPGVMHGCRKAPIMTIGINPNMTGYFASPDGARWSYPKFENPARYAYYYRHHSIFQESVNPDFVKNNIKEGTAIIAEDDGWLINVVRSVNLRWIWLTILYKNQTKPVDIEIAWTSDSNFVVLVQRGKAATAEPFKFSFKKGDIIGGKVDSLPLQDVEIYSNSTGYYQRYIGVLEKFKKMVGDPLTHANLTIKEDVAQHDMVACASPGWNTGYDIPMGKIASNCVDERGFLVSQLVQSKPAVIVLVGSSTLEMFAEVFAKNLEGFEYATEVIHPDGSKTLDYKETYQLLRETVSRKKYLRIKVGDYELVSRIVVSPHFSYPDNFIEHSRMSSGAWEAFTKDFEDDAKILEQEKKVNDTSFGDILPILIKKDDPIKDKLSVAGWEVLMGCHYAPITMMAEVLKQEYDAGTIAFDAGTGHLKRVEGSCKFCVNDNWTFTEGCPYGKNLEPSPAPGALEEVVKAILPNKDNYHA